ncbi:hypothetical protein [Mesorhizobium onobrychidis]|uniref:hypothetical protein n=1 Tax=Mesorhizobium onobrychidis TaxID=2775404 RepID=UPI0021576F8C|nr:hypothetical protein [Mesorhizobium onobrychidis]
MFSARWQIDAKFGHKQTVLDLLKKMGARDRLAGWHRRAGVPDHDRLDRRTGSDGRVTSPSQSLAQLEEFCAKIGKIDAHAEWGKEMEPYVVSGTSLWNIYRIVE